MAVEALEACYSSIKTLFLFNKHIVEPYAEDMSHVYTYYYDNFADRLFQKLEALKKWAGTGLDEVVGYDAHLIERIATNLLGFYSTLDCIHQEQTKQHEHIGTQDTIDSFQNRTKEFFSDLELFCPVCNQNSRRKVAIIYGAKGA